jgi:hypothetical protein
MTAAYRSHENHVAHVSKLNVHTVYRKCVQRQNYPIDCGVYVMSLVPSTEPQNRQKSDMTSLFIEKYLPSYSPAVACSFALREITMSIKSIGNFSFFFTAAIYVIFLT